METKKAQITIETIVSTPATHTHNKENKGCLRKFLAPDVWASQNSFCSTSNIE